MIAMAQSWCKIAKHKYALTARAAWQTTKAAS